MKKYNIAIMGAGGIAIKMSQTLHGMDANRVCCYAVASRSLEKAKKFATDNGFQKAYGSYEELVKDEKVDLIYIATPHSEHFNNAKLCIENKKACLVEKAFTANAKQAEEILSLAKKEKVFITEAIWVRYMPFADKIREVIASGIIGKPSMLTANLGYNICHVPRLVKPELAGGALLDVGVYALNFASMYFGNDIKRISSTCTFTSSGVDEQDSITLIYNNGRMAVLNSSMLSLSDRFGMIHGEKGFIQIENINNPQNLTVSDQEGNIFARYDCPKQITGYEYEVEASLKAIESGQIECAEMPHSETLKMVGLMDSIRKDWGLVYPFEK